jgi:hypothetical protein
VEVVEAAGDTDLVRAIVLAALLVLAGCAAPNQPGVQRERMSLPGAGSDGGGGGGGGGMGR